MDTHIRTDGGDPISNGVRDAQRGPQSPRGRTALTPRRDTLNATEAPFDGACRRTRRRRAAAAAVFGGLTFAAAALGASVSGDRIWYRSLFKSRATPPAPVFGPVWTGLYAAIAWSGYRLWRSPPSAARTGALGLWFAQLGLNAAWSPLFFGAHRPKASAAVVGALVPTIAAYGLTARKADRTAAALMLPYLGWSAFATYLNVQIVRKNAFRL